MRKEEYDVVVVGSGVGGMCSAALLANRGYRTLVIEKLPIIGGRCSTLDYKGFKIPTGVVGVPLKGVLRGIFDEVGAEFDVQPFPAGGRYRFDGHEYVLPQKGQQRSMISDVVRDETEATAIEEAMTRAGTWQEPSNEISIRDWFLRYTTNAGVLAMFQNMCARYLITNAHETSAQEFFLTRKGMIMDHARSGYATHGSISLMQSLARVIQDKGGEVRTRCRADRILVDNEHAVGVSFLDNGEEVVATSRIVISNAGPKRTVSLAGREHFDQGHLREVARLRPAFQMYMSIVSDEPLYDGPFMTLHGTRRALVIMTPTVVCPDLAPAGKHLHISCAGPESQVGPWNMTEEVDLHLLDLRENIPRLDKYGKVLHVGCYRGDFPTLTNGPFVGWSPMPQKTPVENLYNVGDGVGPKGWSGSAAGCALTARIAVDDIISRCEPKS